MDLGKQLSALLGRQVRKQIRKTDETPPRVSIIDVAVVITGQSASNAGLVLRRVRERYPAVNAFCIDWKFPGPRQKNTPVTDARGIVELVMLFPGEGAARVRRQAAELLCRWVDTGRGASRGAQIILRGRWAWEV